MNKEGKSRIFIFGLTLLLISSLAFSTTGEKKKTDPSLISPKAKTIAIFKNGFGFFIEEGEGTPKDGFLVIDRIPRATLGSFWISILTKDTYLEEAVSCWLKEEKKREIGDIDELIKHNIGKRVRLTAGREVIEGTIKKAPGKIVIIETERGSLALRRNIIAKVEFIGPYSSTYPAKESTRRIRLRLTTKKRKVRVRLAYLAKGITWVPSYLVNIERKEKARITMKAAIVNDIEDLKNADLFLVVGYPNFLYANHPSPIDITRSLSMFITNLTRAKERTDYVRAAKLMVQSATPAEAGAGSVDYGYGAIRGLSGASTEDLFFYEKKGVTLNRRERAYCHLFSALVPYQHIYEWDVEQGLAVNERGYRISKPKRKNVVWHSIKLSNTTRYPWTTAPAFVISGEKPIAQDIINYTPKGAKTNLKLTIASDIKTKAEEKETARKRGVRLGGIRSPLYDLVTVSGKLTIRNLKSKGITIEVRKRLTGEVLTVSHNGKVKKMAEELKGLNPHSLITWKIPLKPGEETVLTYTYQIYIRP